MMLGTLAVALLAATSAQTKEQLPFELDAQRKPTIQTKGNVLIQGGTVITVTGPVIEHGDVLIQNGKIAQIGTGLTAPSGVTVIDARGKFVTPGLIDAHSHMGVYDNVNEFGSAVSAEVQIADIIDPESPSFYQKLAAGMTSALVLHGSANPIGGQSQIIKLRYHHPVQEIYFPGAPRVMKFALGENVKNGNDTEPPTRFPNTRMGVEAVFRRAFNEARTYMAAWDKYNANPVGPAPRKDLRLEALADVLRGKIIIHCHAYRQDEMLMLTQVAKEYGIKLKCFTHVLEGYKIAPELAERGIMASTFADAWSYKIEVQDAIPYNAALLWRAGVVTSVNTDTFGGLTPFNIDAAKPMRFGRVPPEEAIKFVTINPAKQLEIDKWVGSLETGKDGDIAIWEGHPLSAFSRCVMTLIDGEVYFQRRDAMKLGNSGRRVNQVGLPPEVTLPVLPADAKVIALVNGTVHPVSSDAIEGGTVVIQDGKIAAIGKNVQIPSGAQVLDVKGLHVYPGLIDAQSELGLAEVDEVRPTRDSSEIGTFQPDIVAGTAVNPESEHIPVTRLGGITTSMVRPLGLPIAGQGSLMNLGGFNNEEMTVVHKAALYINFPVGVEGLPAFFLKSLTPEQRRQREEDAKQNQTRLREYLEMAKRYLAARKEDPGNTPQDLRLDALEPYLTGQKPTVISASSAASIKEAVKMAQDLGLKLILAGGKDTWRVASFLAEKKVPVLLNPAGVTALAAGGNGPAREYDPYDAYITQPAVLNRAGVMIAFGSNDSATAYELPLRAAFASAYGLPYDEALKAITINPAKMFGLDDKIGSLETGKIANVIVVDGDPLEVSTSVKALFISGKPVPLESRWTRLYDKYKVRVPSR